MLNQMAFVNGIKNTLVASDGVITKDNIRSILKGYEAQKDDSVIDIYVGYPDKTLYTAGTDDEDLGDYDCTTRDWYKQAVEQGKLIVTDPYNDSMGSGMFFKNLVNTFCSFVIETYNGVNIRIQ